MRERVAGVKSQIPDLGSGSWLGLERFLEQTRSRAPTGVGGWGLSGPGGGRVGWVAALRGSRLPKGGV